MTRPLHNLVGWLAIVFAASMLASAAHGQTTRPIGMNPGALRDYTPEAVYSDAVRTARIDVNGKSIPAGATVWPTGNVRIWLARDIPRISAGRWLVRVKGGDVRFTTAILRLASPPPAEPYITAWISVRSDGRTATELVAPPVQDAWYAFDVPPGTAHVYLDLIVSKAPDYIRVYRPGILTGPTTTDPPKFNPAFVALLKPFPGFVRGMDWLGTNSSPVVNFADQPGPDSITYNGGDSGRAAGSYADFFDLCNQLGHEPYINLPHKATTQCVRDIAAVAKATVKPGLRTWIEHSNETWNVWGPFQQTPELQAEAEALVAAGDTALSTGAINKWEYRWRLHARRTAQRGAEFAAIFGRDRTVIALGCHGEESWWTGRMLEFLKSQSLLGNVDCLMIAPYCGDSVKTTTRPARTVDEVFNGREDIPGLLSDEQTQTGWNFRGKEHAALGVKFGKKLGFYEDGIGINHPLVTLPNGSTVPDPIILAAQVDPRMGLVVTRYVAPIPSDIPGGWFNLATEETNPWGLIIGSNVPTAKYEALVKAARGE